MSRKRRTRADEPFMIVRTSTGDHGGGAVVARHTHDWHQLVYVSAGLMTVRTAAGSWVAPPTWAVWVPAGTEHAIRFVGDSALRTAYVRPGWKPRLPGDCRALAVSPLLRELVLRATGLGMLDRRDPVERALATLLVHELGRTGPPPLELPEPATEPTIAAARLIAGNAPEAAGTATLARAVGLATRTLERRFQAETGLTLGRWRRHRMLLHGLELVAAGTSVHDAATASGYASPSAFIAAFRTTFGATPARYF
jgi:AraC-like DNA-binding protein